MRSTLDAYSYSTQQVSHKTWRQRSLPFGSRTSFFLSCTFFSALLSVPIPFQGKGKGKGHVVWMTPSPVDSSTKTTYMLLTLQELYLPQIICAKKKMDRLFFFSKTYFYFFCHLFNPVSHPMCWRNCKIYQFRNLEKATKLNKQRLMNFKLKQG